MKSGWCVSGAVLLGFAPMSGVRADTAGDTIQLPEIVRETLLRGQTNGPTGVVGYTAANVSAATKTNTPIEKIPASVSVITRENLSDRNVQTLNEAVLYSAGAEAQVYGYDPRFDSILIRGFDTTYSGVYRDGLRLGNAAGTGAVFRTEPYGLDAITILRGPSAATYGYGSPGGILDVTSKRPVFATFREVQLQFGNFERKQVNVDFGGPVAGTKDTVAYRFTGVWRDANAFPTGPDSKFMLAPAITFRPDGATSLTLLGEYQSIRFPGNASFYNAPNYQVTNLPSGDPAYGTTQQRQYRIGYSFEHALSNDLILRQNFRYAGLDLDWRYAQLDSISADGASGLRSDGHLLETLNVATLDSSVEKHLTLGPTKHVLLVGLDYTHSDFSQRAGFGSAPPLNLQTRNYGQQYVADPPLTSAQVANQDQLGTYLQDQIDWGRATLTLSGRHDGVETRTTATPAAPIKNANDAFTGRAGLNYKVLEGVVPYISYATTFEPNLGAAASGQPFAPTRGDQKEVGVKTKLPNANVHLNGALFEIVETGILRTDPTNPAFSVPTGKVRARGGEVEAVGRVGTADFTASYTHLDMRFVSGDPATNGNRLSGLPGDTVAGFAKYGLPLPGLLGGLSLGGGVRYTGWSFADDANTATSKAYTLFDALVAYDFAALRPELKGVSLQVNGYNVFDRYATTCQAGYCYRVAPTQVIGTLAYRW